MLIAPVAGAKRPGAILPLPVKSGIARSAAGYARPEEEANAAWRPEVAAQRQPAMVVCFRSKQEGGA